MRAIFARRLTAASGPPRPSRYGRAAAWDHVRGGSSVGPLPTSQRRVWECRWKATARTRRASRSSRCRWEAWWMKADEPCIRSIAHYLPNALAPRGASKTDPTCLPIAPARLAPRTPAICRTCRQAAAAFSILSAAVSDKTAQSRAMGLRPTLVSPRRPSGCPSGRPGERRSRAALPRRAMHRWRASRPTRCWPGIPLLTRPARRHFGLVTWH